MFLIILHLIAISNFASRVRFNGSSVATLASGLVRQVSLTDVAETWFELPLANATPSNNTTHVASDHNVVARQRGNGPTRNPDVVSASFLNLSHKLHGVAHKALDPDIARCDRVQIKFDGQWYVGVYLGKTISVHAPFFLHYVKTDVDNKITTSHEVRQAAEARADTDPNAFHICQLVEVTSSRLPSGPHAAIVVYLPGEFGTRRRFSVMLLREARATEEERRAFQLDPLVQFLAGTRQQDGSRVEDLRGRDSLPGCDNRGNHPGCLLVGPSKKKTCGYKCAGIPGVQDDRIEWAGSP